MSSARPSTSALSPLAPFLPAERTLPALRAVAARCEGCDLYRNATQTVFGEGPERAPVVLVGEQPGDREDREGRPFVGPAGQLLDEALALAGVPRAELYVTNAVKHFKFEQRGKRRLHKRPATPEIRICNGWLLAEIEAIAPRMIVCLGATAAQSFMGASFRITQHRGEVLESQWAPYWMATHHPAAILRFPDPELRRVGRAELVRDLSQIPKHVPLV